MAFQANIDFSGLSDSDLRSLASTIVTSMTGNTYFTTPLPALAAITTAGDNFQDAIDAAADGGKEKTSAKNDAREVLAALLRDLGRYVTTTSQGTDTATKILSSGFPLNAEKAPVGPLDKPQDITLSPKFKGKLLKGFLRAKIKALKKAKMYQWEYRLKDAAVWIVMPPSTQASFNVPDVESGKEYEVRVLPMAKSNDRTYSEIASSFAL